MRIDPIARNYAVALYEAADQGGVVGEVQQDLEDFRHLLRQSPELKRFLRSFKVTTSNKIEVFQGLFRDKLHLFVVNMISLLVKNKREEWLEQVCDAYVGEVRSRKNIAPVTAYTALEMANDLRAKVVSNLGTILGKEVELTEKVDPSLIGGIRLRVNNTVYDGSVAHQLEKLQKNLR